MTLKEQIKHLEEILITDHSSDYDAGKKEVARQALVIIKAQDQVIKALIEVNQGLAKVKTLLEENDEGK